MGLKIVYRSHQGKIIRIIDGCEVWATNSVTTVTVRHHEVCQMNRYPEWRNFHSHRTTLMDSFPCISLKIDCKGWLTSQNDITMKKPRTNKYTCFRSCMKWSENNLYLSWILMTGGAVVHFASGQLHLRLNTRRYITFKRYQLWMWPYSTIPV